MMGDLFQPDETEGEFSYFFEVRQPDQSIKFPTQAVGTKSYQVSSDWREKYLLF